MRHITGILLAGGNSTRMGAPKGELPWHDHTLAGRALATLRSVATSPPILALRHGQQPPREARGLDVVCDPGDGPLVALAGVLRLAPAGRSIVCPVDMPLVTPTLLQDLLAALDGEIDIAVPAVEGTAVPLPMAIRTTRAPHVSALAGAGHRSLRTLLTTSRVAAVELDAHERSQLVNVNTPADYSSARELGRPISDGQAGRISR